MTITGNPASFRIMGAASEVNSLVIPFSPIQSFNGYDHPWIGTDYDQQPYNFRAVSSSSISPLGNSEMGNIVGGTVAWNQHIETAKNTYTTNTGITFTKDSGTVSGTISGTSTGAASVQLSGSGEAKVIKDHIFYARCAATLPANSKLTVGGINLSGENEGFAKYNSTANSTMRVDYQSGVTFDNVKVYPQFFDLTAMFGSTIADYIYNLEQATAGAGVAYFRKLFPKDYYEYNAGELLSVNTNQHKMVGFNAFNPETGTARLVGGMQYQITGAYTALSLDGTTITPDANGYFTPSADGTLTVTGGNSTTTCVHLVWDGERDGDYEPYKEWVYPLDSTLILRGIPKLDANNQLYYDGDTYESDGTVTRKTVEIEASSVTSVSTASTGAKYGIVDISGYGAAIGELASNNFLSDKYQYRVNAPSDGGKWFRIISKTLYIFDERFTDLTTANGILATEKPHFVYTFATLTTETATAYAATQSIDPDGTEEYVDYAESQGTRDVAIPVGHYTNYANICPISGRTGLSVYVSPTTAQADATTYPVSWQTEAGTVYGGSHEVVGGVLTDEWAEIPSYNGETITEPWLSSMDEYTPGATPTMGAQVVYKLATPLTYQLTPQEVELLVGQNYVWADTGEAITIDFDVLSFIRQKFKVNNVDFSSFVERDGYKTSLAPVYGETIQTLDGVGHTAMLRLKGELSLKLNPRTAEDTASLCTELLKAPCEVQYHCLQRNMDVTALMTIDSITAAFLSRCLYWGQRWNQTEDITLTEL